MFGTGENASAAWDLLADGLPTDRMRSSELTTGTHSFVMGLQIRHYLSVWKRATWANVSNLPLLIVLHGWPVYLGPQNRP